MEHNQINHALVSSATLASLKYLEILAQNTGTDIKKWPTLAILRESGDEKRAINKAFFNYLETKKEAPKETLNVDLSALQDSAEAAKLRRIEELQVTSKQLRGYIGNKQDEIARYVESLWAKNKEIMALENRPSDFVANDVKRLLEQGFWRFVSYSDGELKLATVHDVIMREKAPGIDRTVNLGRYIGALDISAMSMALREYSGNKNAREGGYFHPYANINSEDNICWGNASNSSAEMLASGRVYDVYMLLASLLTTYSRDSTPYAYLREFEGYNSGCLECGHDENDCVCCGECGRNLDDDYHTRDCSNYEEF